MKSRYHSERKSVLNLAVFIMEFLLGHKSRICWNYTTHSQIVRHRIGNFPDFASVRRGANSGHPCPNPCAVRITRSRDNLENPLISRGIFAILKSWNQQVSTYWPRQLSALLLTSSPPWRRSWILLHSVFYWFSTEVNLLSIHKLLVGWGELPIWAEHMNSFWQRDPSKVSFWPHTFRRIDWDHGWSDWAQIWRGWAPRVIA